MGLSIRQAGLETGLTPDTLRYYERIGLLGPVARNGGGQRRYSDTDIARLRFVRRAQAMDFSLEEISELDELEWMKEVAEQSLSGMEGPPGDGSGAEGGP